MAYNKLIDLNLLSSFLSKIKSLIPTKTSDLENDSEYITGMEILSYGNSTWNDFLTAYTAKKVVYCRASSNSNPASGSQTRLAFMAYVNNADNPTNVEFQYYRSVNSHTSTQQGDQVFVYKLDKTSGWSVITREASSKVVAGTNMTSSYSNGTLTLNADTPTKGTVGLENVDNIQQYSATNPPPYPVTSVNGSTGDVTINIPSNISDLTNDSGYITGITSSDVTTALGYTPSNVELLNNYRTTTEQNEIDDAQNDRLDAVEQATTATTIGPVAIATFDASATNMPIKNLTVNIEPIQDLHGYDSPWPAGDRKNLLNPDSERFYRYITDTAWKYSTDSYSIAVPITPNTTYTLSGYPNDMSIYRIGTIREESLPSDNADVSLYQVVRSTTYADFGASCTITTDEYATYLIIQFSSSQMASVVPNLQLELGSTATSFAPYSNICPISGWTNCKLHHTGVSLIGGDAFLGYAFAKTDSGYELTYSGSGVSQRGSAYADITGLPAGRYTLQFINYTCPDGDAVTFRFRSPGGSWTTFTIIGGSAFGRRTFTMPANTAQIQFYFSPNTGASVGDKLTADDVVLMREEDAETPEPYKGNTYDITFPSEAGTVYGGTLDVVNRKLNSYPYYSSYNGETIIGPWISSMDVYTPGATPTLGAQVVDMGGAATSYDLSDVHEITTFLGTNNIWANCGDVTVTYGAYLEIVKTYADQAADSAAAAEDALASIPSDYTELSGYVDDLKSAFGKELNISHFSPTLYVASNGDYYYFDTSNLRMQKSSSKKYITMRYLNAVRPDYVSVKCNVENIKMKLLQFDEPATVTTSNSTGYLGSEPYTTGEAIFPKDTKNFLLSFSTVDETVITSEQITAIQNNIIINKLADTNFVRGKTEMGGISSTGYLTNADVWQNTRSEKMYKVVGLEQITIVFDSELPSYVSNITIYFYDSNGDFLSNTVPAMNIEAGHWPSFTMPDGALYFKILVSGASGTNIKRHEYFTIRTRNQITEVYNPNIINTTVTNSLAFCYEITPDAETSGRLLLPPNYTVDGDKVPLIVFVHGSGCMMSWSAVMGAVTNAGQSLSYLPYLQYLTNEGFAVFDCYPWSNKETIQSGTYSPFIAPINIAAYMRGIDYVCSRFNVDKNRVSMICKSQGGHIGNWAIMQKQFPFKTVSMLAPSCGIGLTYLLASSKCREALTKYIEFNGTSEEISAFISSGAISNANVASFISKNKAKLLSMSPMAQGITNGNLEDLLDGSTHGQSTVPQWMLDLGLPTKPAGSIDIYTLSNSNEYVKNGAVPSKFWAAFDDDQVSGYSVFSTYYWLCNGASDTEFRQLPNGTGGHHAMDTDANALKSSGTTALGITYTDVPTAYVEVVDFIRSRCGD